MKMPLAVLVASEHECDIFLLSTHLFPFTVLRFCFQLSAFNAFLFSFFLKKVHFWITFSSFLTQGQTVFYFCIFHSQLLFPCNDCKIVTSNPSFLAMNFRLTCFQLMCFLLNSSKKPQCNNVLSMNRPLYILDQMAFTIYILQMGWLM